jgi:hypothetical protein
VSGKVWNIASPKVLRLDPDARRDADLSRPFVVARSTSSQRARPTKAHPAVAAYLLGPIAAGLWGSSYAGGMVGDLAAVAVGLGLIVAWSPLTRWLGQVPYGPAI